MAKEITIELKGQTLLIKNLRGLPNKIRAEILDAAHEEFTKAASVAKSIASTSNYTGDLVEKISTVREGDKIMYQSLSEHAAYAEFGIRGSVRPTNEFKNIAKLFKGPATNSSGLSAKDAIYKWANAKNINKKFWYPIYMKIIGYPLRGKSTGFKPIGQGEGYFFKPFMEARKVFLKRANDIVKNMTK